MHRCTYASWLCRLCSLKEPTKVMSLHYHLSSNSVKRRVLDNTPGGRLQTRATTAVYCHCPFGVAGGFYHHGGLVTGEACTGHVQRQWAWERRVARARRASFKGHWHRRKSVHGRQQENVKPSITHCRLFLSHNRYIKHAEIRCWVWKMP